MISMSQRQLPSSASQVLTVCRYELLKFLRGRKIIAIIGISFAIPLLIIVTPELFGVEQSETARDFFLIPLGFISILLVITGAFFGTSALNSEFQEKTGYILFPNPVTRTSIWFGKFIASAIIGAFVIAIYYSVVTVATLIKYQNVPQEIVQSAIFAFVFVIMIMSISFLISSVLRGSTGAAVLIFFLFILILPILDGFLVNLAEIKPVYSPSFSAKIIQNVLVVPYPSDLEQGDVPRGPFDQFRFVAYVDDSLSVLISYSIIASIVSILLFKRKEMT